MKHLAVTTEYSFKKAFAHLDDIVELEGDTIGIADWYNTFGHISLSKKMKEAGKKPIFGVRCTICKDMRERFQYGGFHIVLLARNDNGLKEIYKLTSLMWDNFFYFPRLSLENLAGISKDIIILNESYIGLEPSILRRIDYNIRSFSYPIDNGVYLDSNNYIRREDRQVYELMAGSRKNGDGRVFNFTDEIDPQHILSEKEVIHYFGKEAADLTEEIAKECNANVSTAEMVRYHGKDNIRNLCYKGAIKKQVDLDSPEYRERLEYELDLISSKGYDDYFLIVGDMINYAKRNGVLVGPSRGSSAGSLVCYLMSITEVDPIVFGLVFERFIDVNRFDLPDIDIDFPDDKRDYVIKYLVKKYGKDRVATLANINRFKPKSAIGDFAAALFIPAYETEAVKNSIIERSGGDARAEMCIMDTLEGTDAGKEFIEKYPTMNLVADIEGHASHAGKHAAGVMVSDSDLSNFGGVNSRDGIIMMDKKDADYIGLLKIDILGLRTLTILSECCDSIGLPYEDLYTLPLDNPATYKIFNDQRLSGVFQFEGQALKILTKQMGVYEFNDIAAITSLARPGALNSGGASRYVKYKTGIEKPIFRSEIHKEITGETMGIVIYQEQMMEMARKIGHLTWADVCELRRAASKSLGDEFFSKYKKKFVKGALSDGTSEEDSEALWGDISATGSWTFNKCLSGDTKVILSQAGGGKYGRKVKIKDLYDMYVENPKPYVKTRMNKGIGPQLISLFPDGRCRAHHSCDIIYNGKKEVVRYIFDDGSEVKCTPEHKFLINGKWKPIGFSDIGDEFTIGEYEKQKLKSTKSNVGYGYIENGKDRSGSANPAYKNGVSMFSKAQQKIARKADTVCGDCGCLHQRMEVHHNDFNHGLTSPNDTVILCPSCHKKIHYKNGRTKQWGKGYCLNTIELVDIEYVGYEDTYDIEMKEHHNFLIDGGLVTHNSHAVSYGLVSYWCAYMKANHPLEFAVANLNNSKDTESAIRFLRDIVENDGIEYIPVDPDTSEAKWTVQGGKLIGGLTNIDGIGDKKAKGIIATREANKPYTTAVFNKLLSPVTSFDILFPTKHHWGHLYDDPNSYGLRDKPDLIKDVDGKGNYIIIGRVIERDLRDRNDYQSVVKRGGKKVDKDQFYLKLIIEDDTDSILAMISHMDFEELGGKHFAESLIPGKSWVMIKGKIKSDWRMITAVAIVDLEEWQNS